MISQQLDSINDTLRAKLPNFVGSILDRDLHKCVKAVRSLEETHGDLSDAKPTPGMPAPEVTVSAPPSVAALRERNEKRQRENAGGLSATETLKAVRGTLERNLVDEAWSENPFFRDWATLESAVEQLEAISGIIPSKAPPRSVANILRYTMVLFSISKDRFVQCQPGSDEANLIKGMHATLKRIQTVLHHLNHQIEPGDPRWQ